MSVVFSLDHVLASTKSATSEYSTRSQCLGALLGQPGRVKFILWFLLWFCCGTSGCVICQKYMVSGESNTPPLFRRLQQIWNLKTESMFVAHRATCIPDSHQVAAYVCVNLACTSSIILQTRYTTDAHPLIIRSPSYYSLTYVTNAIVRFMVGGSKITCQTQSCTHHRT